MDQLLKKITRGQFHFNHVEFTNISPECKDLIKKLLVTDPDQRLSGQQAIAHPWFAKFPAKMAKVTGSRAGSAAS